MSRYSHRLFRVSNSVVECHLAKVDVEGSNPFSRSGKTGRLSRRGKPAEQKCSAGFFMPAGRAGARSYLVGWLSARVHDGRITVAEPAGLPDGALRGRFFERGVTWRGCCLVFTGMAERSER